ncbi:MAG TPA: ion channel [Myxococcota bacterium]|nr:ion channel [Myxococcota bacterium]
MAQPSYEVRIVGARDSVIGDLYHAALRLSWARTIAAIVTAFMVINAIFALGFLAVGGIANARPGNFADAFFFSVQTMGTIGYGAMYPQGLAAHLLVVTEAAASLVLTGLATGLIFSKFSLPTGKVAFAQHVVISPMDGVPTLQVRVGNERRNSIAEATVRLDIVRTITTAEGVRFYRMSDLTLSRGRTPALTRSWTLLHPLDANSPLFGATPDSVKLDELEIVVSVVGTDDVSYQPVHARHRYEHHEILWGARHADVLSETPDGNIVLDVRKFHEIIHTEPTENFPYSHRSPGPTSS